MTIIGIKMNHLNDDDIASNSELDQMIMGRFRVESELYRSGSSTVYKAYDIRMERTIVLKRISASKKTKARALREAKTVALLNHPNIVTIYEFIEDPEAYYLVMEYVEGLNLKQILDEWGHFDVETGIAIISQVCYGLEYAHNNDVIHRDIKPENLMILPDGRVKIMDFGIAHLRDSGITEQGMIVGTLSYMSPEQAGGEPIDERSDIFSLGVVTYEVMTGINPFYQDTAPATIMKITEMRPDKPSIYNMDIDDALDRYILKALNKDPDDRYDYVTDLRYKLERVRKTTSAPELVVRRALGTMFEENSKWMSSPSPKQDRMSDKIYGFLVKSPIVRDRLFPALSSFSLASFMSHAVTEDVLWRSVISILAGIVSGVSPASGFILFSSAFLLITLLYLPLAIFFVVPLIALMYLVTRSDDRAPFYFALLFPLFNISGLVFLGLFASAVFFRFVRAGISALVGLIIAFVTGSFILHERSLLSLDIGPILSIGSSDPIKVAGAISEIYTVNTGVFLQIIAFTGLVALISMMLTKDRTVGRDLIGIFAFYLITYLFIGVTSANSNLPSGGAGSDGVLASIALSFVITSILVPLLTPYQALKRNRVSE